MKSESLISVSPVVTNALVRLNDERLDAKGLETCGHHEAVVATTDDDNLRVAVVELGVQKTLVGPRERAVHVTVAVGELWEPLKAFDRGVQDPDAEALLGLDDAKKTRGDNFGCVEKEVSLDIRTVGLAAVDFGCRGVEAEVGCLSSGKEI